MLLLKKAQLETDFPLLGEIKFKIKKFNHSVNNIVFSDDETAINQFLKQEVVDLFQQLKTIAPSVEEDITKYFIGQLLSLIWYTIIEKNLMKASR